MGGAIQAWNAAPATRASGDDEADGSRILKAIMDAYHETDKIVMDKGRGWPAPGVMEAIEKAQGHVKIVATVRPVAECLASFVKIVGTDDVKDFCKNSDYAKHLFSSYHTLKAGWEKYPDKILLVEYDNLIADPQKELDRVADFLGIERKICNPKNVKPVDEDDKVWGIKDLHKVRKTVSKAKYDPKDVLGQELWDFYQGGSFWKPEEEKEKKPELLDMQRDASRVGDFEKARQISELLPDTDRAAFNKGWIALYDGKLQEGYTLLNRGRREDIFGDGHIGTHRPLWQGEKGIVLLYLEGGFGDQIHQVRYAREIAKRGCKVIVSCSYELATLFTDVEGVSAVVQHEAARGVYFDYWVQGMSAVLPLKLEYKDLDGSPYIRKTAENLGNIGIRWNGNPNFQDEAYRRFPAELLFKTVEGKGVISLQHGEGSELKPASIPQADVHDWEATRKAISECKLVISSDTSVAHLSAAMGIETWIVVPVLPYFLWALPGKKTPYYNSVTLFRQQKFGDWTTPFEEMKL